MKASSCWAMILVAAGTAAFAVAQKAEPNPQVPATSQANSPSQAGNSNAPGMPSANNAQLQGHIQQALQNEPSLSSSHVSVNVSDAAIELTGSAASVKAKETAERIAQSFDGNRQFVDKLIVVGNATTTTKGK